MLSLHGEPFVPPNCPVDQRGKVDLAAATFNDGNGNLKDASGQPATEMYAGFYTDTGTGDEACSIESGVPLVSLTAT